MFASQIDVCTTPEQLEAKFQGGQLSGLVPAARGDFRATLTRLKAGRVWLQQCKETLPRSLCAAPAERYPILFLLDGKSQAMKEGRVEIGAQHVARYRPGSWQTLRTCGPSHWATMSMDPTDFDDAARLIADRHIEFGSDTKLTAPSATCLARLRTAHFAAARLTTFSSQPKNLPSLWESIEHELIVAMVECLSPNEETKEVRGRHRHKEIIRAFRDWLESNLDRPVHILEVCKALNVPARTLHLCCSEYFGMGPKRYILLRRMRLARESLLKADATTTVTSVATSLGFWDLSHFTLFYRSLFDELPSATLRQGGRQ